MLVGSIVNIMVSLFVSLSLLGIIPGAEPFGIIMVKVSIVIGIFTFGAVCIALVMNNGRIVGARTTKASKIIIQITFLIVFIPLVITENYFYAICIGVQTTFLPCIIYIHDKKYSQHTNSGE